MNKLFLVAQEEALYHLRQWTFYLSILGLPILFAAAGLMPQIKSTFEQTPFSTVETIFSETDQTFTAPTGYVDQAKLIIKTASTETSFLKKYATETEAQTALEAKEIDSYYVIASDYITTGTVIHYSLNAQLFLETETAFNRLLREHLLSQLDTPHIAQRLANPANLTFDGPPLPLFGLVPAEITPAKLASAGLVLWLFAYAITLAGNLMLRALHREIKAQVLETLLTQVTASQFIGGKLLGISFLVMGQTGLTLFAGAFVYGRFANEAGPAALSITTLLLSLPYLILGYLSYTGFVMSLTAAWPTSRENAALLIILRLMALSPILGVLFIIPKPNEAIAIALSVFPPTASLLMPFRLLIISVPWWQWVIGLVGLGVWTYSLIWLSIRIFRANMLLTGKRLQFSFFLSFLRHDVSE